MLCQNLNFMCAGCYLHFLIGNLTQNDSLQCLQKKQLESTLGKTQLVYREYLTIFKKN